MTGPANSSFKLLSELFKGFSLLSDDLAMLKESWAYLLESEPNEIWEPSIPAFAKSRLWIATPPCSIDPFSSSQFQIDSMYHGAIPSFEHGYHLSKLLEVLLVRELVSRLNANKTSTSPPVTITIVNPGLCVSSLDRDSILILRIIGYILRYLLGRSPEVGARTLVYGACAGPDSHGEFMSDGQNQGVEQWIYSDMGKKVQKKLFEQTMKVLEARKQEIGKKVGLG
ncbi:uncharacterized protein Z518_05984 [Rhinocladiella mackenziei CBS 650.93]|uniref:Uncharacterized protein n=1 Tax=Rhinocladiella mackenziei CBS 650.93 TaxID=1442369 RepID=A0A0D2FSK6_9EURO|nr:uncharacterized protein Z518_05984 [Rhinocladiella mackenziei CBS 650.93]KIX05112.1 hypothetical protein Z518_05984 [Rhinocladiella mackenziei CBS 650.93]